jgi:hypothetical protein
MKWAKKGAKTFFYLNTLPLGCTGGVKISLQIKYFRSEQKVAPNYMPDEIPRV